jgi:hypothetical protein
LVIGGGVLAFAVAGAVALVAPNLSTGVKHVPVKATRTSAIELRRAAMVWRSRHETDNCPEPEQLRRDGVIDQASRLDDAWGEPLHVVCEGDGTSVVSSGPDRRAGTADDIRVPEPIGAR